MLVFQRPFEIGDLVEISGKVGRVDKVDLFSVRIKTAANETVYIPNGKLITDKIINKAHKGKRRLEILIGIDYDSDLKKAKHTIYQIIEQHSRILSDPAPLVAVNNLGDSEVELTVRVWTQSKDYGSVRFDLLENIKTSFDDNGIIMPYPQMNVWLNKSET
jgi:small conductance mechanosensitive channel